MLTKGDLRWNDKVFSLYSDLMLLPVTFRPDSMWEGAGEMRTEKSSIWRRIAFKFFQIVVNCDTFFMAFRILECMMGGDERDDADLDWDLLPMMIIFFSGYLTVDVNTYFIFDSGRQLNIKIYNELRKLRGKKTQEYLFFKATN